MRFEEGFQGNGTTLLTERVPNPGRGRGERLNRFVDRFGPEGRPMTVVNVIDVLDANTLMVSPAWHVNGATGHLVRIHGMAAPDVRTREGQKARSKVAIQLLGSLLTVRRIHSPEGTVLPCELEYMGLPLRTYFPEYAEGAKRLAPRKEESARQSSDIVAEGEGWS